jgi:type I restriction enzyme S subunit
LESIDSRFAQWLFGDLTTIRAFRKASKGVVDDRLRLYPKDLFPIPLVMPKCIEEQSCIADRLDALLETIASAVRALEKLRLLKRGLMRDLLTGNRRVTALLEQREGATA